MRKNDLFYLKCDIFQDLVPSVTSQDLMGTKIHQNGSHANNFLRKRNEILEFCTWTNFLMTKLVLELKLKFKIFQDLDASVTSHGLLGRQNRSNANNFKEKE